MLQILDLSGNISSLPENPAFSNMPQLRELYLRYISFWSLKASQGNIQNSSYFDCNLAYIGNMFSLFF